MKNTFVSQTQQGKLRSQRELTSGNGWFRYRCQPTVTVGNLSLRDAEILALYPLRQRTRFSLADGNAIHGANGRDLGCRSAEEQFIRHIQELAGQHLLADLDSEIPRDGDDRVPRDPLQDSGGKRRRVQTAVADREEVLTAAFGDVAERIEHDALGVLVLLRFHLAQLRIEVIAARFGHRGKGVRRRSAPARHAYVDTVRDAFLAEVRAPFPGDDERLHRDAGAVHAHLLTGADHERPDIAFLQVVADNGVDHALHELIDRVAQLDAVDLARVVETTHVLARAKDRAAGRGFVAPYSLENAGPVMHHVAHDVDRRVFPVHQLAVAPDLLCATGERGSMCHVVGPWSVESV